ncbi:hypothetical protein [Dokdonella sp.]|uniref:hypothetical protein n=1 Tax=Dokdonella sp. TaxID=2291710 RepID=UPI003784F647
MRKFVHCYVEKVARQTHGIKAKKPAPDLPPSLTSAPSSFSEVEKSETSSTTEYDFEVYTNAGMFLASFAYDAWAILFADGYDSWVKLDTQELPKPTNFALTSNTFGGGMRCTDAYIGNDFVGRFADASHAVILELRLLAATKEIAAMQRIITQQAPTDPRANSPA